MRDYNVIALIKNVDEFLQKNHTWYVLQHLSVLLDTAAARILSQNTVQQILITFSKTINTLLQNNSIQALQAVTYIDRALHITKYFDLKNEKKILTGLREKCATDLESINILTITGNTNQELDSPRYAGEEVKYAYIDDLAPNNLSFLHARFSTRSKLLLFILAIVEKSHANDLKITIDVDKQEEILSALFQFTKQLLENKHFSQAVSFVEKMLLYCEKGNKQNMLNDYKTIMSVFVNPLKTITPNPGTQSDQIQGLLTPIEMLHSLPKELDNERKIDEFDKTQMQALLFYLTNSTLTKLAVTKTLQHVLTFYPQCIDVGDIGIAYHLLERSTILADEFDITVVKHELAIAQGDLLSLATDKAKDRGPLKPPPNFNQIEESLLNFFSVLPEIERANNQDKLHNIQHKITSIESNFVFQITRKWIAKNLANKMAIGINHFEQAYSKIEPLGQRLIDCGLYDAAWCFYTDIKSLLTQQTRHWHSILLQKIHYISQALLYTPNKYVITKGDWQTYREQLAAYREVLYNSISETNFLDKQKVFAHNMKALTAQWLQEGEVLMGPPDISFCIFGLGSMSRNTMAPFSDLECGILVKDQETVSKWEHWLENQSEPEEYLNTLFHLFKFKIASIGEIGNGFRLDKEGQPTTELRLIGTPESLLKMNSPPTVTSLEDDMAYSLLNPCYLYGNQNLLVEYQTLLQQKLQKTVLKNNHSTWQSILQKSFLPLHIKHLHKFDVTTLKDSEPGKEIDIKKYYIAPLMYIMGDYSLYYKIPYTNTESTLKVLKTNKEINTHWAEAYLNATIITDAIRVRLHMHYQEQLDVAVSFNIGAGNKYLTLTGEENQNLELINLAILIPAKFVLEQLNNDLPNYLYYPAKRIVEKAINDHHQKIPYEALRSMIATNILAKTDADAFLLDYMHLPQHFRNAYKINLQAFKHYFKTSFWDEVQYELLHCPLPDGTRESTIQKQEKWQKLFSTVITRNENQTFKKNKNITLSWFDSNGSIYTQALHPDLFTYLINNGYLDSKGDLKDNQKNLNLVSGDRLVIPVETKIANTSLSVHNKFFPEIPGMDHAVNIFSELVTGWGTPLVQLAKLTKGKQSHPILYSKTAKGTPLNCLITGDEAKNLNNSLDNKSYSQRFVLSLLLNQDDAKPSNMIAKYSRFRAGKIRLVCVDNDRSFFPSLTEEEGRIIPIVKDITYCFEKMHEELHPTIREQLLYLDPYTLLRNWLQQVQRISDVIQKLFTPNEIQNLYPKSTHANRLQQNIKGLFGGSRILKESIIGITLREHVISHLYVKFTRLQNFIIKNEKTTHYQLLLHT